MLRFLRHLRPVGDLLFPGGCACCDVFLPGGDEAWCLECATGLALATAMPACPRCGLNLARQAASADGCFRCRGRRIRFEGIARVGEYHGLVGTLVRRLKFEHRQHLDRPLGRLLATALDSQPWACEVDALVPVPISWRYRWTYSFSPPEALARVAGGLLGLPVLPILQERGKRRRQLDLPPQERRSNVRGVFRLRQAARPAGRVFCIIDDVMTTGSTLEEIAGVLIEGGATRVYAAVLARASLEHDTAGRGPER